MTDREKLIELISDFVVHVPHEDGQTWEEACADHLLANGVTVQQWIPVSERLPEPEQEVFVCVRSKISNYSYVCCAMYVPENWYRQSSDFCWDFECCDDYDEEQDDFIVKQGWYESIHNWDDCSVVGIEDVVTHWTTLPEPPKMMNGCYEHIESAMGIRNNYDMAYRNGYEDAKRDLCQDCGDKMDLEDAE